MVLAAGLAVGVIAAIEDVAVAVAAGLACFMVGGIIGFVFGIPRYAASASDRELQESTPEVVKYRANTNLEQISDWLTKILVGLGLTQFRAIGEFVADIANSLGGALTGGSSPSGTTVAWILMVATVIPGFIFFYLWSRVYLPTLFQNAEKQD